MSFPKDLTSLIESYTPTDTPIVPIGTRCSYGGRTWFYAKAGGALIPDIGANNALFQGVAYADIGAAAAVGDIIVEVETAATDGAAGTGLMVKDAFVGGYMIIFSATANKVQMRKITSNEARVATGEVHVKFGIDIPLTYALTVSDHCEIMESPWANVQSEKGTGYPIVGVPTAVATTGQYLWLQTWGPCWLACQSTLGVAAGLNACFRYDGSIDLVGADGYAADHSQHAGFVLAESATQTQGAPFIMLQICP